MYIKSKTATPPATRSDVVSTMVNTMLPNTLIAISGNGNDRGPGPPLAPARAAPSYVRSQCRGPFGCPGPLLGCGCGGRGGRGSCEPISGGTLAPTTTPLGLT